LTNRIRYSIASMAAIVAVVAAYNARPGRSMPDQPVLVEPSCFDCGVLRQGETAKAKFRLTNAGSAPLKIKEVLSHCGCTSIGVPKKPIAPGETAELAIRWEIGTRRNKTATDLLILSTVQDKALFQTQVVMKADVTPDIDYDPSELVFDEGKPREHIVTFSPKAIQKVALSEAYCANRAFTATLLPNENRVRIAFDPTKWHGDIERSELVVKTNSPNEPQCRIRITVRKSREEDSRR
jgi:hypothetical protein